MIKDTGQRCTSSSTEETAYWQKMAVAAYVSLLACLPVAYIFLLCKLLLTNSLFFSVSGRSLHYIDFVFFYMAGKMMLTHHQHSIYDPAFQLSTFNSIYPYKLQTPLFAQQPPYCFIMLAPMACLSITWAFLGWTVLAFLLIATGLVAVARAWRDFTSAQIALLILGIAASLPIWTNLRNGGSTSWIVAAIALFIWAWKKNRDLICGAALALVTVFKPQHCPFLAMAIVASRRWKLAASVIVVEIGLIVLAGSTVGWENVRSYPAVLVNAETSKSVLGVLPGIMINCRGLIGGILAPQATAWVVALTFVAGMVFCGWLWICAQGRGSLAAAWAMSLTLIVGLIAAPHVHLHDCLLLAFPAILTLPVLDPFKAVKLQYMPLRIWSLILLLYPLIGFAIFLGWEMYPPLMQNNAIFALLNIALLVCGTLQYRKLLIDSEAA